MQKVPVLAYLSHHKCGTQWTNRIVDAVSGDLGLKNAVFNNAQDFGNDLRRVVVDEQIGFVSYVNADYREVKSLDSYKGFHVIRDPRDIVVSAYFSHLHSHPTDRWPQLVKIRQDLTTMSKVEGLFYEMNSLRWVFDLMFSWDYQDPNVLEVKFEDLVRDPYDKHMQIFRFLGCLSSSGRSKETRLPGPLANFLVNKLGRRRPRLTAERLIDIVDANEFSKMANGRSPGEENVHSHYRKGIPGDWVNHFSADHILYFKREYNDLLEKLGYEQGRDW